MGVKESLVCYLFSFEHFKQSDPNVIGVARRAIRFGFGSLSDEQKSMLKPFLSVKCCGYTDSKGEHCCSTVLEDEALLDAFVNSDKQQLLRCRNCRAAGN